MNEKLEILFIRACKSKEPHKRVLSVYRRYYHATVGSPYDALAMLLLDIVKKYNLITITRLAIALHPEEAYKFADKDASYWEVVSKICISSIRLSAISEFGEGFIMPLRWRNEKKSHLRVVK